MESLFSDTKKFKKIVSDPTYTRLKTIQRYLKTLNNRGEISDEEYKAMRPQNAKPARAHGLPKIHKNSVIFQNFDQSSIRLEQHIVM